MVGAHMYSLPHLFAEAVRTAVPSRVFSTKDTFIFRKKYQKCSRISLREAMWGLTKAHPTQPPEVYLPRRMGLSYCWRLYDAFESDSRSKRFLTALSADLV